MSGIILFKIFNFQIVTLIIGFIIFSIAILLVYRSGYKRLTIKITDESIVGPQLGDWKPYEILLKDIDIRKTTKKNFLPNIEKIIYSKSGKRIFIDKNAFDKDQVSKMIKEISTLQTEANIANS